MFTEEDLYRLQELISDAIGRRTPALTPTDIKSLVVLNGKVISMLFEVKQEICDVSDCQGAAEYRVCKTHAEEFEIVITRWTCSHCGTFNEIKTETDCHFCGRERLESC